MKNTFYIGLIVLACIAITCITILPVHAMQDTDIAQPETYTPHILPGEESTPEEDQEGNTTSEEVSEIEETITETLPEETPEPLQYEPVTEIPDVSNWWYAEPTPSTFDSPAANITLGYSSDIELLKSINAGIYGILTCFVLLISVGVVYLICRIVWPLFNFW